MKAWQILLLLGGAAYLMTKKSNAQTMLPKFNSNPSAQLNSSEINDEGEIEVSNSGFEEKSTDIEEDTTPSFVDDEDDSVVVTEAEDDFYNDEE